MPEGMMLAIRGGGRFGLIEAIGGKLLTERKLDEGKL
jgi:hypothetical protein